jgi:tetratricopeptide (TPR) repeat protein
MHARTIRRCTLVAVVLAAGAASAAPERRALGDLSKVGSVRFATSCRPAVKARFARAVALLHSFFYEEARRVFTEVAAADERCAMAQWGIAMTWTHPLWAPPSPDELRAGREAIDRARALAPPTRRERDYIDALATFYHHQGPDRATGGGAVGCHGPMGDHAGRALAYAGAMERLHRAHPRDAEAAAFFALALLGSAPPTDATLANQKRAAELLEGLWRGARNHPGVAHYLIHAYDHPPLARRGLPAAKAYAAMAPWVPHVLHMPSHIFIRLGMWDEAIRANLASAEAARAYAAQHHPDAVSFEELHALDYLVYGYLQIGDDARAREAAAHVAATTRSHPAADFAAAYAVGAVPARFALERRAWAEAAALPAPAPEVVGTFPFAEAHVEFARGLGRARGGELAGARAAVARLDALRDGVKDARFAYFARHIDVQRRAVAAWILLAEGKGDEAARAMTEAARLDDELGKHPVSPGSILPARELLGELLLELGRADEALAAFEASLELYPRRFAGVAGAARAAEAAGKSDAARRHHRELLALAPSGDRPELARARAFLGKERAR